MEPLAVTVARPRTTPSNLLRRQLCPGSAQLEAGLPDEDSQDAKAGRLFHRYWGNREYDRSFLSVAEQELLELSDRLLDDVLNRLAFEMTEMSHVEQSIKTSDGKLFGTPDKVYVWWPRKTALVVDLKSGFGVVERAELNLQLRGYAVLVSDAYIHLGEQLEHIYVALLQPRLWSPSERITLAHYERSDIKKAREQINSIIDAADRPSAFLNAGEEQCRYCRAKLMCPEFRKALTLPVGAFRTDDELSKAAREALIDQRVKQCSDDQLERVLEACKLAGFIDHAAKDEARLRIKSGLFKRFILGKEWEARTITNVRRAIAMCALSQIASREEILDSCDISLDKLEKKYREHHGGTWQQARDKINRVLNSVIAKEPRQPKILKK